MAEITIAKTTALDTTLQVDSLSGSAFTNESGAHKFVISCTRNGSAVTLSGTVTGRFMRSDNTTILLDGSISSGKAVVTLPGDCYNVPGRFQIAIFVTNNDSTTCVYAGVGSISRTQSGTLIDSGNAVPSIETFMDYITQCTQATANANAAAAEARLVDDGGFSRITKAVQTNGIIASTGKWASINNNNKHIVIPVNAGDEVVIQGHATNVLYFSVLQTYDATQISTDNSADVTSDSTLSPRVQLNANVTKKFTVPNDGRYLLVVVLLSGNDTMPQALTIDGYDYTLSGRDNMLNGFDDLTDRIDSFGIQRIDDIDGYFGYLGSTGTWINFNGNYIVKFLPCNPGDSVKLAVSSSSEAILYYGLLVNNTVPVLNANVPYSSVEGFTTRGTVAVGGSVAFDVPTSGDTLADGHYYLALCTVTSNNAITFDSISIGGIDMEKTVYENMLTLSDIDGKAIADVLSDPIYIPQSWDNGTFNQHKQEAAYDVNNRVRRRIKATSYKYPIRIVTDGVFSTVLALLDSNSLITDIYELSNLDKVVPKNTAFRLAIADPTDLRRDISALTSDYINEHVKFIIENVGGESDINWIAMGDSITEGWYSWMEGNAAENAITNNNWATRVAAKNNWNLTNIGIGGTGYLDLKNGTGELPIEEQKRGYYIARHTDFTPYNLVTLAYGINDWKDGNFPVGTAEDDGTAETPTTFCAAMKATIEAIMNSNPYCKIIVILPLNCIGYEYNFGTYETNYALGYQRTVGGYDKGTLNTFVQKMIEVCDWYGIQYIDQAHYSVVNRENLRDVLPDGVHPSLKCHELLGDELSKKITFG